MSLTPSYINNLDDGTELEVVFNYFRSPITFTNFQDFKNHIAEMMPYHRNFVIHKGLLYYLQDKEFLFLQRQGVNSPKTPEAKYATTITVNDFIECYNETVYHNCDITIISGNKLFKDDTDINDNYSGICYENVSVDLLKEVLDAKVPFVLECFSKRQYANINFWQDEFYFVRYDYEKEDYIITVHNNSHYEQFNKEISEMTFREKEDAKIYALISKT